MKLQWPIGTLILFLVLLAASVLNWGTIEHDFSGQGGMVTLHGAGPTPPNYVTGSEELPRSGSLWQSGLQFVSVKFSYRSLVLAMGLILIIEVWVQRFGNFRVRPVAYLLDGYGLILSGTSIISFLYQGYPGIGAVLVFSVFSCMAVFHVYQHGGVRPD